jgi:hypothetical protein
MALRHVQGASKDNLEIVFAAVTQNRAALQYASPEAQVAYKSMVERTND